MGEWGSDDPQLQSWRDATARTRPYPYVSFSMMDGTKRAGEGGTIEMGCSINQRIEMHDISMWNVRARGAARDDSQALVALTARGPSTLPFSYSMDSL